MKKKVLIALIGFVIVFTSCRPYEIFYSVEGIYPFMNRDSIDVRMIDTTAIFSHGRCFVSFALEITNKKKCNIIFGNNSILALENDTMTWRFKRNSSALSVMDSLYYVKTRESKVLDLCCYNIIDSIPTSIILNYLSKKEMNHKIILYLDLEDINQSKLEKQIILNPVKMKRL